MTDEHPTIDDAQLGVLTRATTVLTDGESLTHDWFVGTLATDDGELELMLEGTTVTEVTPLLPRLRAIVNELGGLRRRASDAVVTRFSHSDPEPHELDEGAADLTLDTIEAAADGTIVLHFTDTCGDHFPEGYWPAVHLAPDDTIIDVTVES
ncbi:hypothetical protein [Microbacterium oxydans]|uniref:DUF2262 domain-containing protein n=1 Tax=Microbacterium oxydans TaxID=82380 RepID=A0A0F0L591_9MICO|nr:hypothetical protein [Microbacterium oxydans]KJL27500.1 hypothetical protein RS83_02547 [Microbacterium oxydans]